MHSFKDIQTSTMARKRAGCFIYILCIVILLAAALIVYMMLDSRYTDLRTETERHLAEQVASHASKLSQMTATQKNQMRYMANMDIIRLFAVEMYNAGTGEPEEEPSPADTPVPVENASPLYDQENAENASAPDDAKLRQQTPAMRKLLGKFVRETALLYANLLTTDKTVFVTSLGKIPELTEAQLEGITRVLESGTFQFLPLYRDSGGRLISDILYPIFPPLYVTEKESSPIAVLMVSCDMSGIIKELPSPNVFTGEQWRILQKTASNLQDISPLKDISFNPFPRWYEEGATTLSFGIRSLPDGSHVYSSAVSIPDTSLMVSYEVQQSYAEESYEQYKKNLLMLTVACLACVFMLIGMAWWWLMGQREKAVTGELHTLYKKVTAQKQLLNKVNSVVPDGIVLKDLAGKIAYANSAFAKMVGIPQQELFGQYHDSLVDALNPKLGLHPKSTEVLETGVSSTYTETLTVEGKKRIYQVVCSPLRDDGVSISDVVIVYRDISDIVKAHEKSQYLTHQMVTVLVRSLETVDPYLSGQSMLTADLAHRLGRMLGLEFVHVTTVRAAASLSQLGMLQLPAGLRTKEGALSVSERQEIRKHVDYAQDILAGIDFGVPVQKAIYEMYECVDGTGYPQGLAGVEICVEARVLSVANTFCALMRPRSYRQAHDVGEALHILSGPKFDPVITECLNDFLATHEGQEFLKKFVEEEANSGENAPPPVSPPAEV